MNDRNEKKGSIIHISSVNGLEAAPLQGVYGMTKADGLTLGMFQAHRYMQQLTGLEEVKFDLRKFNWIGTMEKTEVMFYVRADAPYKSFDDVVKASEPLRCGATGSTDG